MIYLGKKFVVRSYKKAKHKFIKRKKKAISNNDLYKIVLLNTTIQKDQSEERYTYLVTLFFVFLILCGLYTYHAN